MPKIRYSCFSKTRAHHTPRITQRSLSHLYLTKAKNIGRDIDFKRRDVVLNKSTNCSLRSDRPALFSNGPSSGTFSKPVSSVYCLHASRDDRRVWYSSNTSTDFIRNPLIFFSFLFRTRLPSSPERASYRSTRNRQKWIGNIKDANTRCLNVALERSISRE